MKSFVRRLSYCFSNSAISDRRRSQYAAYKLVKSSSRAFRDHISGDPRSVEYECCERYRSSVSDQYSDYRKLIQSLLRRDGGNNVFRINGDICGTKEYFFSNQNIMSSRDVNGGEIKMVLNLLHFATVVPNFVAIMTIKASIDHRFVAFLVELRGEATPCLFMKDIDNNIVCRLNMSCNGDIEVGDLEWTESGLVIVLADKLHRPYRFVHLKFNPFDRIDLLGKSHKSREAFSKEAQTLISRTITEDDIHTLMTERDPRFFIDVGRSKDDNYIFVCMQSKLSSEIRYLKTRDGNMPGRPQLLMMFERRENVKYFADHDEGYFFVASNIDPNSDLKQAPPEILGDIAIYSSKSSVQLPVANDEAGKSRWMRLWPIEDQDHANPRQISVVEDFDVVGGKVVVYGRRNGIPAIELVTRNNCGDTCSSSVLDLTPAVQLAVGSEIYDLVVGANKASHLKAADFTASNLHNPGLRFRLDVETGVLRRMDSGDSSKSLPLQHRHEGGVIRRVERVEAISLDGTRVPMTLFSRAGKAVAGQKAKNPTLLVGYGSYGMPVQVGYDPGMRALLDLNWTIAFAHVRGGGELGAQWHEGGRVLKKWNTFHDFAACAQHLVTKGISEPSTLCAMGSSAGGLIMGVMANEYPQMFAAILMRYPFLDPFETLQRPELALTVHEYDEFGDMREEIVRQYVRSYSPCSNVKSQVYPSMFVTTALQDQRVSPDETMKWASLVRKAQTDRNRKLVVNVLKDSGHDGPSSQSAYLDNLALEICFLQQSISS